MRITTLLLVLLFNWPIQGMGQTRSGEWSGAGGTGYAYLFTNLAYRIHRELLMEAYLPKEVQARDEMNLANLLMAIDRTKVITTDEIVIDKHGHEQTAKYYSVIELRELYTREGKNTSEINRIMKDLPLGLIVVNNDRFNVELASPWGVALATVFHEYRRSLGLPEDNYQSSSKNYDIEFFARLAKKSTSTSKEVYGEIQQNRHKSTLDKIEIIEIEKNRLKREIAEDSVDLEAKLNSRRPFVKEQRVAYQKMINAYANVLENISVTPSISPSVHAPMIRAIGKASAEGLDVRQKMSEVEVINLQITFLEMNLKRNMKFYETIDSRRNELFLTIINEEKK